MTLSALRSRVFSLCRKSSSRRESAAFVLPGLGGGLVAWVSPARDPCAWWLVPGVQWPCDPAASPAAYWWRHGLGSSAECGWRGGDGSGGERRTGGTSSAHLPTWAGMVGNSRAPSSSQSLRCGPVPGRGMSQLERPSRYRLGGLPRRKGYRGGTSRCISLDGAGRGLERFGPLCRLCDTLRWVVVE